MWPRPLPVPVAWWPFMRGIYIGACVAGWWWTDEHAHAHHDWDDPWRGWVCFQGKSSVTAYYKKQPTQLLLHEAAHLKSGRGHTVKWGEALADLGGEWPAHYTKDYPSAAKGYRRKAKMS